MYNEFISTYVSQIKYGLKSLFQEIAALPVVFIAGAVTANLGLLYYLNNAPAFDSFRSFGGPEAAAAANTEEASADFPAAASPVPDDFLSFALVENSYLAGFSNPLGDNLERDGLMSYTVKSGDTVSKIAAEFGISADTVRWSNPNLKTSGLVAGRSIVILPVSGVLHTTKDGETLESIAGAYSVSAEKIREYNGDWLRLVSEPGSALIVPDGRLPKTGGGSVSKLPNLTGYFTMPTTGWNWGKLHNKNAVDIANACGTPIYAAAEGLVVSDEQYGEGDDGYNGGYGLFVLIEHPNGTKTRYAHNLQNLVSAGDYVLKGDKIAQIGNTGNTHGVTGCHLHFEVIGARNPFAK